MNKIKGVDGVFILLLTVIALVSIAQPAIGTNTGPKTGHNISNETVQGDRFMRWDFRTKTLSRFKVDFAINVIFTRNATINRVKSAMDRVYGVGRPWASYMYGRVNPNEDGQGAKWDLDSGRKTSICALGASYPWGRFNVLHYRIYAPNPPDYMYNQAWGQYVIGTTHIDHKECGYKPPSKWSGRSELAEWWLSIWGAHFFGNRHVRANKINLRNGENRQEYGHWWENNGRATRIEVCLKKGGIPCN